MAAQVIEPKPPADPEAPPVPVPSAAPTGTTAQVAGVAVGEAVGRPDSAPVVDRGNAAAGGVDGATVVASALLLLFGVIALFGAYLFVGSGLAEHRKQDLLYSSMTADLKLAAVPVGGVIATGTPVGIVSIPRLGLEQVFEVGSSSQQTLDGPGLRHDSVLPGQAGVSVLVGRRATAGAPFKHLDELAPGDDIDVTTGQGQFTYTVDVVRRSDTPSTSIRLVPARLTLVTSDPAITNTRTLQVSAVLKGTALPASTGPAAGVTSVADDTAGQGGHGRTVALLLWAQALLAVVVIATWAAVRLQARVVWIGAVPLVLAVLWHVFENLTILLPNTL